MAPYVESSNLVENVLQELCDKPAPVFATTGNYFQPNITLFISILIICIIVTFNRISKLINRIYQRLRGFDDVNIPVLIARIVHASQQPRAIQKELLEQMEEIAPQFKKEVFGTTSTNFISIVENHANECRDQLFGKSNNDNDDNEQNMNEIDDLTTYNTEKNKKTTTSSSLKIIDDDKKDEGEIKKDDDSDKSVDHKISSPLFRDIKNFKKLYPEPKLTKMIKLYFAKDRFTMVKVIELFEVTTNALENPVDRQINFLFLLCNFILGFIIIITYFSQKGPEGGTIFCHVPYYLSIVCFKPFTIPMWACITVTCQYTFSEILFGQHPRTRDITGTCISSPIPRNFLSILIMIFISILYFLWMLCAFVIYLYPLITFLPILIFPASIIPLSAVIVPMVLFDTFYHFVHKNIKPTSTSSSGNGGDQITDEGKKMMDELKELNRIENAENEQDNNNNNGNGGGGNETVYSYKNNENGYPLTNPIIPKVSETITLLKFASFQMVLIISISFILIQFYRPENFTWQDGVDAMMENTKFNGLNSNSGFDNLFYEMKKNFFKWPNFNDDKNYEIMFILGISFCLIEYFMIFGFMFLRWYQTLPLFLLNRGSNADYFKIERILSYMFAFFSWMPFRATLNLARTGLEASYQQWQINIIQSKKEVIINDKHGSRSELIPKYDLKKKILYSILWFFGSIFLIIPIYYTILKPYIKVFDNDCIEDDIRDFFLNEIALCYEGIEIQNNKLEILDDEYENERKSKTFEDLLGHCIWFKKLNLSRAKKIKIDLKKLSHDFINFTDFNLHAIYGQFEDFTLFKNVKNIKLQEGNETLNYADALAYVCSKFPLCTVDVIFLNGRTLLHRAASIGDHVTTKLLIDHGSNIEASDIYGATPLLTASFEGKETVVKELTNRYADVEALDKLDRSSLLLASWTGHEKCVEILLLNHADTEILSDDGGTPLHKAAFFGYEKCVTLLLEHAADTEVENNNTHTALHEAVIANQSECVKVLVSHLADTEALTENGRTPLIIAAQFGYDKCVEALVDAEADLEATNKEGCTPLILAASGNFDKCCDILLGGGADVEAIDEENATALMVASEKGNLEAVISLLKHGADPSTQDLIERTASDIALEAGHADIVEILKNGVPSQEQQEKKKEEEEEKQLQKEGKEEPQSAKNEVGSSLKTKDNSDMKSDPLMEDLLSMSIDNGEPHKSTTQKMSNNQSSQKNNRKNNNDNNTVKDIRIPQQGEGSMDSKSSPSKANSNGGFSSSPRKTPTAGVKSGLRNIRSTLPGSGSTPTEGRMSQIRNKSYRSTVPGTSKEEGTTTGSSFEKSKSEKNVLRTGIRNSSLDKQNSERKIGMAYNDMLNGRK